MTEPIRPVRTIKQRLRAHLIDGHDYEPPKNWTAEQMRGLHMREHHLDSPDHSHAGPNSPNNRPPGWYTGADAIPNPGKAKMTTVTAQAYDARQCPICQTWVYTAAGPFAEGDATKTLADYEHWAAEHATAEELNQQAVGFPYFSFNDTPVLAVVEHRPVR